MQVIFQSGGIGSRLYPFTKKKPKCFLKIKDKTIFSLQYEQLKKNKLHKNLLIISNDKQLNFFKDFFKYKTYKPKIISEVPGLDTGGSLIKNYNYLEKEFILIYSDIFFKINFKNFLNYKKNKNKIFCHKSTHPFDSDLIELNEDNLIKKIYTKKRKNKIFSSFSLSGIFFLKKKILSNYKVKKISLSNLINLKLKKNKFYYYLSNDLFLDFGNFDRLKKLKTLLIKKKIKKNICIILDRDGTIISEKKFVNSSKKIIVFQNFIEFLKKIKIYNPLLICISNQAGVAKGFIKKSKVDFINRRIIQIIFDKTGLFIDKFYYCPHHPEKGFKNEVKKLKIFCKCRKPEIQLFEKALNFFKIKNYLVYNIGNSINDIKPGLKIGIKNNYLISKNIEKNKYNNFKKFQKVNNFKKIYADIYKDSIKN